MRLWTCLVVILSGSLGCQSGSEAAYQVKGLYRTFSASVGVGDESNADSSVEFVIVGDGKELWRSGSLKKADGLKQVTVEIAGVQRLVLRTAGAAERRSRLDAAWVDAALGQ